MNGWEMRIEDRGEKGKRSETREKNRGKYIPT